MDIEDMLDAADQRKKERRENERETYLGDGLYARFDGLMVWLSTTRSDGPNPGVHYVAMEPHVLAAFEEWIAMLRHERAG